MNFLLVRDLTPHSSNILNYVKKLPVGGDPKCWPCGRRD